LEAEWVDLLIQHMQEASQGTSLASSPSLELVPRRGIHLSRDTLYSQSLTIRA